MWSAGDRTRPRFGRGDVWAELVARESAVRAGSGQLSLLSGVGGVGKTTFLRLVGDLASSRGFRVASTSAVPSENPPPLQLIRAALRQVDLARSRSASARSPTSTSVVFLPALDGPRARYAGPDRLGAMRDDARSEAVTDRLRFMDSMANEFFDASLEAPLLVTMDDLQWADEASIDFLSQIQPRLASRPLWFLATVPESSDGAAAERVARLRRISGADKITLRPLAESELSEFVRWAAPHRGLPALELRRLYAETDGVPERVVQLLTRATSPDRFAGARPATNSSSDPALGEFSPEAQRVLALAAVAGMEVTLELLASAAGLSEERTVEHLERFIARGLLHEVEDGRFGFDREETRVRICGEFGARRLQLLHRRIAQALEKDGALDMATVYALARHTYLGGLEREALRYNQQAAAFAAGAYEPALTIFYLGHALEVLQASTPDDRATELQLRMAIAVQQVQLGDMDAAETSLQELVESERLWAAASLEDRQLLAIYRARVYAEQGRWEEAERALAGAPGGAAQPGPVAVRRAALGLRGEILFYRGEYQRALEADEQAVALAREHRLPRETASDSIRRATALTMIPGRSNEALEEYRRAIAQLVELGDFSEAAFGALCLGAELNYQARRDEARGALQRAIELAETAQDLRRAAWAHAAFAELELAAGRVPEAEVHLHEARESFELLEDAHGRGRAALTAGRIALGRGEFEAAQSEFEQARSIFASRHMEAAEVEVDLRTSELDLARHEEPVARERLARLGAGDLPRLRPDLMDDWERLRRRLDPSESSET